MIKGISETIKTEPKEQKGFLGMLFSTLVAWLLGNLLTGKGTITAVEGAIASQGQGTIRAAEGTIN